MKMRPLPCVSTSSKPWQTTQQTLHFPIQTRQNCVTPHTYKCPLYQSLHFSYQNKPKLRPLYHSLHFPNADKQKMRSLHHDHVSTNSTLHISYANMTRLRMSITKTTNTTHFLCKHDKTTHVHSKSTKIDPGEVKLGASMPMDSSNNKVYRFKAVVYKLSDLDKELLKISENHCISGDGGATRAIWW
jgi:hypothetical protein